MLWSRDLRSTGAMRRNDFMIARIVYPLLAAILALSPLSVSAERKVGVLLPLSGNFAAVGNDSRQGIEVALEELGGSTRLDFVYADSKADPKTGVAEFRKFVDTDGVLAVYALRGPIGMALNPLSQAGKVALLGGVGNKDFADQNEFAFQLWSRSDEEGAFLAETLLKQRVRSIALVTTQDDWTNSVSLGFRTAYAARGGTIAIDQGVPPSEVEFSTIVSQIPLKKPDAVFVNLALPQIAPFLRRAREQNITLPIYSNFFSAKKEVVEAAGIESVEGVKFVEMDTNLPQFRRRLDAKFHTNASGATLAAYVAAMLLEKAALDAPEAKSATEFYAALLKVTEIRTADGTFKVRDRKVQFPLVIRTLRGGKAQSEGAG